MQIEYELRKSNDPPCYTRYRSLVIDGEVNIFAANDSGISIFDRIISSPHISEKYKLEIIATCKDALNDDTS